jgi:hypothetical protein
MANPQVTPPVARIEFSARQIEIQQVRRTRVSIEERIDKSLIISPDTGSKPVISIHAIFHA